MNTSTVIVHMTSLCQETITNTSIHRNNLLVSATLSEHMYFNLHTYFSSTSYTYVYTTTLALLTSAGMHTAPLISYCIAELMNTSTVIVHMTSLFVKKQ